MIKNIIRLTRRETKSMRFMKSVGNDSGSGITKDASGGRVDNMSESKKRIRLMKRDGREIRGKKGRDRGKKVIIINGFKTNKENTIMLDGMIGKKKLTKFR